MPVILDRFRLLGGGGLRVSPLSLGTMTFGTESGWGTPKDECRRIFDAYVEAGGNFVDTANFYTGGLTRSLDASLARLKLDAIDLYWVHACDFTVPVDGVVRALDDAAREMQRLDEASRIDLGYPHDYLRSPTVTRFLCGDAKIE